MLCPLLIHLARCFYSSGTNQIAAVLNQAGPPCSLNMRAMLVHMLSFCSDVRPLRSTATFSHFFTRLKDMENFLYSSTLLQRRGNLVTVGCQLFVVFVNHSAIFNLLGLSRCRGSWSKWLSVFSDFTQEAQHKYPCSGAFPRLIWDFRCLTLAKNSS